MYEEWQFGNAAQIEKIRTGIREAAEAGKPTECGGWCHWQKKGIIN